MCMALLLGQVESWIQVDLLEPTLVSGIITQGRHDASHWVTSFSISYGLNDSSLQSILNSAGEVMVGVIVLLIVASYTVN